jgi:IS30 family transposase
VLYALRLQKKSFRQIGVALGRHHTTLAREYARNQHGHKHIYVACTAQRRANRRASKQRYQAPLKNCELFLYVREKLRVGWSPELIAGRVSIDIPSQSIHHETIYRYIYNNKKTRGMKLYGYLLHHRKRRMKKDGRKVRGTKISNPLRIDQRDVSIESRLQVGHWESEG